MTGFTTRPVVAGRRGVVASGHYLATAGGFRIMEQGGNAVDAAVAAGLCLNLLEPANNGIGGEAPALVYSAKEKKAYALSGMGWSPKRFTIDWCRDNDVDLIPGDGFLPVCVPSAIDTWALALARFGTMSFSQIAQPAIQLAEGGFPVHERLLLCLNEKRKKFTEHYPSTVEVYYPNGQVPELNSLLSNPGFARVLKWMSEAERKAWGRGRAAGIEAARDIFYKGPVADKICEFIEKNSVMDTTGSSHKCLLSFEDLAEWRASVEEPVSYTYRGLTVHKCSSWTQGPVFLQQLALLEGYDLVAMGHNTAEYLHTLIECAKLAFADREAYYGDPVFDDVPFDILLSKEYNDKRRNLVGEEASREMRPGDAGNGPPDFDIADVLADNRRALGISGTGEHGPGVDSRHAGDTTHLDVVDAEGNMVSATPSGGWIEASPVIRGLGFCLGTRAQMFYLNPARSNALAPRKRPRATLTPSLVTKNGKPLLVFGTPGGDRQDQWTLQFFLNWLEFGMDLQQALEAPTVHTSHFPQSFYPRNAQPGRVTAENRIPVDVISELQKKGHEVEMADAWVHGKATAVAIDSGKGVILGGASPRFKIGYALGW